MIDIDENFEKISEIARIFLTKEEKEKYKQNLKAVMPWFYEMLQSVKITNPQYVYSPIDSKDINMFNDEAGNQDSTIDVLHNTPNKKDNLITVLKVI